jgi:hypothetical protein
MARHAFLLTLSVFLVSFVHGQPIDPEATETLSAAVRTGPVRVVVSLDTPGKTAVPTAPSVHQAQVRALASVETGFATIRQYKHVPALVGIVQTPEALEQLRSAPGVRRVDRDVGGRGGLEESVEAIGATSWHDEGVTGTGTVVAMLDTGIDRDNPDLEEALVHEACFLDDDGQLDGNGGCPDGSDRQVGAGSAAEDHGHGTYITGMVASRGTVAPTGVAPGSEIAAIKVLDADNRFHFFSEIVAALDYLLETPEVDVDIVNMSLGTNALFQGACDDRTAWAQAGAAAVDALRASGITLIASAMNDGTPEKMAAPACLSGVLAVTATDTTGAIADWSNVSSETDLAAPGAYIKSTTWNGAWQLVFQAGTSAAAAHASGCAALLISSGIGIDPDELELLLTTSSVEAADERTGRALPFLQCSVSPIPVELVTFDATLARDAVHLTWRTASETRNAGFYVQRWGGGGWQEVGYRAGSGTTTRPQEYTFTDWGLPQASDTLRYRLRQVDLDGTAHVSAPVEVVRSPSQATLTVIRNPTRGPLRAVYTLPRRATVQIVLYDALGRQVAVLADAQKAAGRHRLSYDAPLTSGQYFLRMQTDRSVSTKPLSIVR